MKVEWYQPLFAFARELFGDQIYAWYFDLSFEETLRRHAGSDKAKEFGEAEMRLTCLFTRHPYLSVKKMPKGSGVILISTQKILKKQEKWPEIAENHQNSSDFQPTFRPSHIPFCKKTFDMYVLLFIRQISPVSRPFLTPFSDAACADPLLRRTPDSWSSCRSPSRFPRTWYSGQR